MGLAIVGLGDRAVVCASALYTVWRLQCSVWAIAVIAIPPLTIL